MSSVRLRLLTAYLRYVEKPRLARGTDPVAVREGFERSARLGFRDPGYACYLPDRIGGVPALWAQVRPRPRGLLIYFHGGAYIMGSAQTHRGLAARLGARARIRAVLPDYRVAPEHRFPAALDDARAIWAGLTARGYRPGDIVLAGDSAGGGLALALLARLLEDGVSPAAAVLFSPWTDLTLSGASLVENRDRDPLLPVSQAEFARDLYLDGHDPSDPDASPLFAGFKGAPPVFLQAARTEILRDDTLRLATRLRDQGVAVTLDLWDDAPHVWPIFQGWLPEAATAIASAAAFIERSLPSPLPDGS